MKILVFLVLFAYANAYGVNICSRGPGVWCQSLQNAKTCGAVTHCIDTVWSTTEMRDDPSNVCQFCENIITDVRKFLTDNATEAQVRDYLDSACALIPVSEIADLCKNSVDDDLEELFQLIDSELNPQVICSAMGLCNGFQQAATTTTTKAPTTTTVKPITTEAPNTTEAPTTAAPSGYCADCKKIISGFAAMVDDQETITQIDNFLLSTVCDSLPDSMQQECIVLVKEYVPELAKLVADNIDATEICTAIHLCAAEGSDALLLVKMRLQTSPLYKALGNAQVSTAEECTFCKIIFDDLQQLDRNTAVQEDVEWFVNTYLCAKLGSYKDVCTETVNEYAQMLFELLATELDPATRCQAIGFCAEPTDLASEILRAVMPATPVQKVTPEKKVSSETCIICETVMVEVKNMLSDNNTEAELVTALEKVCSILPKSVKAQCNDFVDTYGPAVIEMLLQQLDPKSVCQALGLCPAAKTVALPKKAVGSNDYCGICETVIQYLDSILVTNATEAEIKKDLERICNFLPDTIKETCDTLVEQYMDSIIQFVAQGLTPEQVCTEIGLCTATLIFENALLKDSPIVPQQVQMVGVNECTYGPSYWCASEENAKRCKATDHCMAKVWNL